VYATIDREELYGGTGQTRTSPKLTLPPPPPALNHSSKIILHILITSENPCQAGDADVPHAVTDLATFSMFDADRAVPYVETVTIAMNIAPPFVHNRIGNGIDDDDDDDIEPKTVKLNATLSLNMPFSPFSPFSSSHNPSNSPNSPNSPNSVMHNEGDKYMVYQVQLPPTEEQFFSKGFSKVQFLPTGLIQTVHSKDDFPWDNFHCSLGDPDSDNDDISTYMRREEHSQALVFNTSRWSYSPLPTTQPEIDSDYTQYGYVSLTDRGLNGDRIDNGIIGTKGMPILLTCAAKMKTDSGTPVDIKLFNSVKTGMVIEFRNFNNANIAAMRFSVGHPNNNLEIFDFDQILNKNDNFQNQNVPIRGNYNTQPIEPFLLPMGPFFNVIVTKSFPTILQNPFQFFPATTFINFHFSQKIKFLNYQNFLQKNQTISLLEFPFLSTQGIVFQIISPTFHKDNFKNQLKDVQYTLSCTRYSNTPAEYVLPFMSGSFTVVGGYYNQNDDNINKKGLKESPAWETYPIATTQIKQGSEYHYNEFITDLTMSDCGELFLAIHGQIDTTFKRKSSSIKPTKSRKEIGFYLTSIHQYIDNYDYFDPKKYHFEQINQTMLNHPHTPNNHRHIHTTELITYSHHNVQTRDAAPANGGQLGLRIKPHLTNPNYLTFNLSVTTETFGHDLKNPIFSISTPHYLFFQTDQNSSSKQLTCLQTRFSPESSSSDRNIKPNSSEWSNSDLPFTPPTNIEDPDDGSPKAVTFELISPYYLKINTNFLWSANPGSPFTYHISCSNVVITKMNSNGSTEYTNADIKFDDIILSLEMEQNITNNIFSTVFVTTDDRIPLVYFMTCVLLILGLILTVVIICIIRRGKKRELAKIQLAEALLLNAASIQQVSWSEIGSDYQPPIYITGSPDDVDGDGDDNHNKNDFENVEDHLDGIVVTYKAKKGKSDLTGDNRPNGRGMGKIVRSGSGKFEQNDDFSNFSKKIIRDNSHCGSFVGSSSLIEDSITPEDTTGFVYALNHTQLDLDLDLGMDLGQNNNTNNLKNSFSNLNLKINYNNLQNNSFSSLQQSNSNLSSSSFNYTSQNNDITSKPYSIGSTGVTSYYLNQPETPNSLQTLQKPPSIPQSSSFQRNSQLKASFSNLSSNGGVIISDLSFNETVLNKPPQISQHSPILSPKLQTNQQNLTGSPVLRQLAVIPLSSKGIQIEADYFQLDTPKKAETRSNIGTTVNNNVKRSTSSDSTRGEAQGQYI
jgi:hypothetical protein